jgi:hypothetical protein
MSSTLFVTLRHNIGIDSDVALARDELRAICGHKTADRIEEVQTPRALMNRLRSVGASNQAVRLLTHTMRQRGIIAFAIPGVSVDAFERVIRDSAFGQDLLYTSADKTQIRDTLCKKLSRQEPNAGQAVEVRAITLSSVLDYSTKMVFTRQKGISVSVGLDALTDYLLDEIEPANGLLPAIKAAIAAKKTTLYLTHELHLYKGKFFPRMIRGLINRFVQRAGGLIVDPFVGSGTALLEASLLGHASIGVDVDPTSVMISSQKLTPRDIDPAVMRGVCYGIAEAVGESDKPTLFTKNRYSLKSWKRFMVTAPEPMRGRLIKRGREEGYDLIGEVEGDSAKCLCLIDQIPLDLRPIMRVCLSHALTKKLRLRFVGIGNGRFTIDVAKAGVLDLFVKKAFHVLAISEVFAWLLRNGLAPAPASVLIGSAKEFHRVIGGRRADLVVTSPPYIPASSGREHYARARAIPLVFTGAATIEQLDHLDSAFIGEMSAQSDTLHLEESMPASVRRTLEFLRKDEQRFPKYLPTLNYYVDMREVLASTRKCLRDGGKALFVVATSHTFYIHSTKEILHTVNAVGAMADLGRSVGLAVEDIIHIPLKKSGGLNARPRSTDDYSESVIVFAR